MLSFEVFYHFVLFE